MQKEGRKKQARSNKQQSKATQSCTCIHVMPYEGSLLLANEGGYPHNDGGQGRLDVLVGIVGQQLDAGQQLCENGIHTAVFSQSLAEC